MTEDFCHSLFLKDKFLFTDFFAFEEIGLKKLSIWHNIRKKRLFINLFLYYARQFFFERKEKLPKKKLSGS